MQGMVKKGRRARGDMRRRIGREAKGGVTRAGKLVATAVEFGGRCAFDARLAAVLKSERIASAEDAVASERACRGRAGTRAGRRRSKTGFYVRCRSSEPESEAGRVRRRG